MHRMTYFLVIVKLLLNCKCQELVHSLTDSRKSRFYPIQIVGSILKHLSESMRIQKLQAAQATRFKTSEADSLNTITNNMVVR